MAKSILQSERISIHALLAESDQMVDRGSLTPNISIHALLAESDISRWKRRQRP